MFCAHTVEIVGLLLLFIGIRVYTTMHPDHQRDVEQGDARNDGMTKSKSSGLMHGSLHNHPTKSMFGTSTRNSSFIEREISIVNDVKK